jgi:hypothetical protein
MKTIHRIAENLALFALFLWGITIVWNGCAKIAKMLFA